jgi:hypothetical protein
MRAVAMSPPDAPPETRRRWPGGRTRDGESRALGAALIAGSVVASTLMGFHVGVTYLLPDLDLFYVYAMNRAVVEGLRWGRDYVSTYGPYGYLLAATDVGDIPLWRLPFELFLVVASGVAVALHVLSVPGLGAARRAAAALLVLFTLHLPGVAEQRWFGLFLLVLLLGLRRPGRAGLAALATAGVLAGFYPLVRLSLGFGALLSLAAGCALAPSLRRGAVRAAVAVGGAAVGLVGGWAAYHGTVAGLAGYLPLAWAVAGGYSSSMSFTCARCWLSEASFLVFFALLALWALLQRHERTLLALAACAVPLFVGWKHSVVREDAHVRILVLFGGFVVALLVAESLPVLRWRSLPVLGAALAALWLPWFNAPLPVESLEATVDNTLQFPVELRTLARLPAHRRALAELSRTSLAPLVLPDAERARLAGSTVDVYPWEVGYTVANGLAWASRPSPASFGSYTPGLDGANAAFFASPRRPRHLLWHTGAVAVPPSGIRSIDGRHVFWEEPRTLLAILDRYELVGSGPVLVLEARGRPRFASRERLGAVTVPWQAWAPVPETDGVVLAEVALRRPPAAWLRRLLVREDPMFATVRFASGAEATYRFLPDQVGSGLWVSPLPRDAGELERLLRGGRPAAVTAVRFHGGWGTPAAPPLAIAWWRLAAADPG